jgi:hypothetical protein
LISREIFFVDGILEISTQETNEGDTFGWNFLDVSMTLWQIYEQIAWFSRLKV